ncbi:MAG: hypothetical protein WC121_04835 [Candidatus Kapaibacterium sp.]
MKKIILILLATILTSCASDYYALNKFRNIALPTLIGYRGENPLSVSLIADDALLIEENSSTAIREYYVTQYDKSFILKKIKGDYLKLTERTSPLEKDTSIGLKFIFTEKGASVYENNRLIGSNSNILLRNNEKHIFKITQDGDYTTFIVDCDTLSKHKTSIPASEYTLFQTGAGTEVEIYSFDVVDMNETSIFW